MDQSMRGAIRTIGNRPALPSGGPEFETRRCPESLAADLTDLHGAAIFLGMPETHVVQLIETTPEQLNWYRDPAARLLLKRDVRRLRAALLADLLARLDGDPITLIRLLGSRSFVTAYREWKKDREREIAYPD